MILVEGPDGTGKTTLATAIAEHYDLEYRRYKGLSSTKGPDGLGIVRWWREQYREEPLAVYDRAFAISEPIYQMATPNRPLILDGEQMAQMIDDLVMCQPCIIFCLPKWEKTQPIVMSGRDRLEGVTEEMHAKIHWQYWSWMAHYRQSVADVLLYDFHNDNEDKTLIAVGNYLRRRHESGS